MNGISKFKPSPESRAKREASEDLLSSFFLNVCNTKICMKKRKKRLKSNCKKSNIVRKMHMEMDEKIVGEGCHSLQKLSSLLIKN